MRVDTREKVIVVAGRLGQPADVVSSAAFLCSDAASHLSGTLLPIRPVTG